MNWAAFYLAIRRVLQGGCTKWEVSIGKRAISEREESIAFRLGFIFLGKGKGRGFIMQIASSSSGGGMESPPHPHDRLSSWC